MAQLLIACALVSQEVAEVLNSGLPWKGSPTGSRRNPKEENQWLLSPTKQEKKKFQEKPQKEKSVVAGSSRRPPIKQANICGGVRAASFYSPVIQ